MHLPQPPVGWPLPTTAREDFQRLLDKYRAELDAARAALEAEETPETGRRYAYALALLDSLQGTFPFCAAGAADVKH